MQIKIFNLLASASDSEVEHINKFIRSKRVLDIDRHFYVSSDNVAHWSLLVTYLPQQGVTVAERSSKVDYKEVLKPEEFERFVMLRTVRKQLADNDAVPAYAVFTDSELAQIAQLPSVDAALMRQVSGIGIKRMEKYGRLICERYNMLKDSETGGESDE